MGTVSLWGDGPRYTKGVKMFGRLVKWLVTMLFITVAGTLIGWAIPIVIAALPLWGWTVALMIGSLAVFKLAVWVIGESDYGGREW